MNNDEQQTLITIAKRLQHSQALFFSDIKDVHRLAEAYLLLQQEMCFPPKHNLIRNEDGILSVVECYLCEDFKNLPQPQE